MTQGNLSTLENGIRVVEMLLIEGTLTVDIVSTRLSVSRSSAYRLLRTLMNAGWAVIKERGIYELNDSLRLAMSTIRGPSIRDLAAPQLHLLSTMFSETITLSIRTGLRRVPIDQVVPNREVFMQVELGRSWPLHAGASGRAILAAMEPSQQRFYIESGNLEALTPDTIIDRDKLAVALAADAKKGFSVTTGERVQGAFSIAAAFSIAGESAGSIAVCGPQSRFNDELLEKVVPELTEKTDQITALLVDYETQKTDLSLIESLNRSPRR